MAEEKIADTAEVLEFYTRVMRGMEDDASMANRIAAADKLLHQFSEADAIQSAVAKVDILLAEFRAAVVCGDAGGLTQSASADDSYDDDADVDEEDDEDEDGDNGDGEGEDDSGDSDDA